MAFSKNRGNLTTTDIFPSYAMDLRCKLWAEYATLSPTLTSIRNSTDSNPVLFVLYGAKTESADNLIQFLNNFMKAISNHNSGPL